jgi:hypothetical protein
MSPSAPRDCDSPVAGSTIFASVPGTSWPADPGTIRSGSVTGPTATSGLASVMP